MNANEEILSGPDEDQKTESRPQQLITLFSRQAALVAVCSLLLIALATTLDVILRTFWGQTILGLNELTVLFVAVAAAACLPAGFSSGAALTVDLFSGRVSRTARAWLELLAVVLSFGFWAILSKSVWLTAQLVAQNHQTTVMNEWPFAPFYTVMAIALGIGALALLPQLLRAVKEVTSQGRIASVGAIVFFLVAAHMALSFLGFVDGSIYRIFLPSNSLALAIVVFAGVWVLIMLSVPIGVALGVAGTIGVAAIMGSSNALTIMGSESTNFVGQSSLSVLPLFLLMGAFASVGGIGADLFRLANALVGHLRGGLAYASILSCAGFGTVSGSSLATQMTIGRIAIKEMRDRNYSTSLSAGAVAAGGTLGQLIPPSSALIIYAVMTEQSVGRLFMAAVVPGILATILYMLTITVWLKIKPQDAVPGEKSSLLELAQAVRSAWSVMVLLVLVLGGIYFGVFTELEAGAIGTVGAFVIALLRGKLNPGSFLNTMDQSTRSLATIYSLLFGTTMLTFFFGVSGVPQAFLATLQDWGLTPYAIIIVLVVTYLVLGTFMDGYAIMLVTIPIFVPAVHALGFDPLWWGIMTLVCMEAGMISPPFGLNIFVISSLDPSISITTVYRGALPFFFSTVVKIVLLLAFPILATWLPSTM